MAAPKGKANGNYKELPVNASFFFITAYLNKWPLKTIAVHYEKNNNIKVDVRKIESVLLENNVKLRPRGKQGKKTNPS